MSPTQDPPHRNTNQERSHRAAKRRRRSPRRRLCLLKGCRRRYRPEHPWSRYCGDDCRRKALQWSRWKGQQRYRATRFGKQHRQAQSQRYRQRVLTRKRSKSSTSEPARVITPDFFRVFLRSPGLLRNPDVLGSLSSATILLFFLSQGVTSSAPA